MTNEEKSKLAETTAEIIYDETMKKKQRLDVYVMGNAIQLIEEYKTVLDRG